MTKSPDSLSMTAADERTVASICLHTLHVWDLNTTKTGLPVASLSARASSRSVWYFSVE